MSKPKRLQLIPERATYSAVVNYDAAEMDAWLTDTVLPVLEYAVQRLHADIVGWLRGLEPYLDATFYHTLSYKGDMEVVEKMQAKEVDMNALIKELRDE